MKTPTLQLRDGNGTSHAPSLAPQSESTLVWPADQIAALMAQMQEVHPDVYVLHNRWHQSIPDGTPRKQSLRLFYEHNLRDRFSAVECRRLAEECLATQGLQKTWLNEPWCAHDEINSYHWGFLLAALLKPRAVLILAAEKDLPLIFTTAVTALRERRLALIWCSHA